MTFVLTFLLVAGLEIAVADNNIKEELPVEKTPEKEHDMCVGCESPESEDQQEKNPQLTVEVRVDPETGEIMYIIRGIVIE